MTNQEILEKAIQKASNSGWQPKSVGMVTIIAAGWMQHDQYKGIIFNHDFAKALWGQGKHWPSIDELPDKEWEYHLRKMVTAEDPIVYLEQNI